MDEIMDTKVVQMKFDNSQFRAGVEDTIKQLDNLDKSLQLQGASNGLDSVTKASKQASKGMESMADSVQTVQVAFNYLEVAGITAMVRLTNAALSYGKKIANNLWSKSIGQVIEGGKRRSQNISNAKFQLEGLGVAWDDIVDDINYGVKDTAYGLDEAATAASQLVASQVQLGDEMQHALRGISGTAAMTNSSFSEIANIWTTVASNGKLMTMQLRQLSARGLNASAVLAKAMNTTEAAVNEMVTRGEIDFKRFSTAMDEAFGEHAKEANKTFQGALSNMNAALSRIGQKFADPVFENLRKVFIALTDDIDAINKALQPAMDAFSVILGDSGRIATKFLSDEHFVKGLIALAVDFWTWVRTLLSAIQEFASAGIYLDTVTVPFENLAKSLQLYGDKAEYVKDIIKDVLAFFDIFIHAVKASFNIVKSVGEALLNGIGIPIQKIKDDLDPGWLYERKEGFKSVIDVIAEFVALKLADVIHAISQAIKAIDWKTVLQAVVIIVNITAKAILLLPNLIRIINAIFKGVIVAVAVAAAAIAKFIDLVKQGILIIKDIFGIGMSKLFGITYTPTFEVRADTSSAQESIRAVQKEASETTWNNANVQTWDDVAESTDNATESVHEYNEAVSETSDRMEVADKNFRRQTETVQKGYDDMAKSAEDAADRMSVATKGAGPFDPRPTPPPRTSDTKPTHEHGLLDAMKDKPTEPSQNGFVGTFASYFDKLKEDKSQQEASKSALNIWFGGVAEVVKNTVGEWWVKLAGIIAAAQPVLAVVAVVAALAAKVIIPIIAIGAAISIVIKAIDALLAIPMAIGKLADAARNFAQAQKYKSMAAMFLGMAQMLLGVAAAVGVIVLAALIIKEFHLEQTVQQLFDFLQTMMLMLTLIQFFAVFTAGISAIPTAIHKLLDALKKPRILAEKVIETHANWTTILQSMAAMFFALAAELAVVSLSIKMLGEMDPGQLNQGLSAFALVMGTVLLAILAVGIFADKFSVVTKETRSIMAKSGLVNILKGGNGGFVHELEGGGTVIHKVIGSLIIFFATVVGAVLLFGHVANKYPGVLSKGMAMLLATMIAMGGFLYGIMAGIAFLAKDVNSFAGVKRNGKFMETMNRVMFSLMEIILAMSVFMGSIAIVMRSLKGMDWPQILSAGLLIVGSMGMMTLFIDMLSKQVAKMATKKIASSYFTGIAATITTLGLFMLSLAASLAIMKSIPFGQLMGEMLALTWGLAATFAFIAFLPKLLDKLMGDGFDMSKYAKMMSSLAVSMSLLMGSIAATLWALSKVDWSAMEGSDRYLIGVGAFVLLLTVFVGILARLANGNTSAILAASLGTFAGISLLLFAISNLFATLDAVNLAKISESWPLLLGIGIALTLIFGIAAVLATNQAVATGAILVITSLSVMFFALGSLFVMVGYAASLIGDGAMKIASAIWTIIMIDWHRTSDAIAGIKNLMSSIAGMGEYLDWDMIAGASRLSLFSLMIAFAIRTLSGVDPSAAKDSATSIVQFLTTLADGLEGKEQILALLTALSTVLPMLAIGITMAMLGLAVGGVGLVVFAYEMIIFAQLMQQVGDSIGPAVASLVTAISQCGDAILLNSDKLLVGMLAISAFAVLLIVTGTLLTVGGLLISAGAGLLYLSGSILGTAVENIVAAISKSGTVILQNVSRIRTGILSLVVLSVAMSAAGATLIVGGTLFALGSAIMLGAAVIFGKAVDSFGKTAVKMGLYANATVTQFKMLIVNLKAVALEAAGLGPTFAQAAVYTVMGFIEGIDSGIPLIAAAMTTLGTTALTAFLETLGIHSPATEMIKAAYYTVEGFIEGLTESAPGLAEVCTNIVEGVVNIFSGGSDDIAEEGGLAAGGFGLNFESVMQAICPDMAEMLNNIGTSWGDGLGNGLEEGFKRHIQNLINYENELARVSGPANWTPAQQHQYLVAMQDPNIGTSAIIAMVNDFNAQAENRARHDGLLGQIPTYTPLSTLGIDTGYIDINDIYNSLNAGGGLSGSGLDTTSAMASAISGSSGAGSGINDQSKAASIGGGVGNTITNSNNTYNFVQNNYSPEALDRSEIYQQTRSQLNSFYGFMREKNPAF